MTKVSNCGSSETGGITGKAGDQTGGEYRIRSWYDFGQDVVLWHPDGKVNELVADLACEAAANDKVGYDQGQRETFWNQLKKVRYRPANIKTKCEADCSSSTATVVKAAGYILNDYKLKAVPVSCWTGNLKAALVKAGYKYSTSSKYTRSDKYLPRGSINLNQSRHVNVNVTAGSLYKKDAKGDTNDKKGTKDAKNKKGTYVVTAEDGLNVRAGDTTRFPVIATMKEGTEFEVAAVSENGWGYLPKYDGWACLKYAERA